MNDFVLRAKHWQVFLLLVPMLILVNLIIVSSPLLSGFISAVWCCIYLTWFALLGNSLFALLPRVVHYNLTWFTLDIALLMMASTAVIILTDDRQFQGEGLAALLVFYLFFAIGHVFWFLAASLVAVEKQRKPELGFYFGTLLLFVFWLIGVWFIQARLNAIVKGKYKQPLPLS
jgi:hypothetical protein